MSRSHRTSIVYLRSQDHAEPGNIHTLSGLAMGETVLFASAPFEHDAGPKLTLGYCKRWGGLTRVGAAQAIKTHLPFTRPPLANHIFC